MSTNLGVACYIFVIHEQKSGFVCVCVSFFFCLLPVYICYSGTMRAKRQKLLHIHFWLSFLHFNELLARFIHSLLPLFLHTSRHWHDGLQSKVKFIRTRNMMLFVYGIFTEHKTTNEN